MDLSADLAARVAAAAAAHTPLALRAGGSKDFYGQSFDGTRLDPRGHRGIVAYEPTELVVTVRAGTPLAELEAALAAQGQALAFEPPHFGSTATVGGCIASGLAGPRRTAYGPLGGAVRDFVLGCRVVDGRGQVLSFGGTVMKNVAGYDMARLMAGALGTLGLLLDVSLKVLPLPAAEATLRCSLDEAQSLRWLNTWAGQPLPLSASAWSQGTLVLRLSGARAAVQSALARLQHDVGPGAVPEAIEMAEAASFWRDLREHADPFFAGPAPLWRLAVPSTAAPLGAPLDDAGADPAAATQLIEWHGAQRWLRTTQPAAVVRARAAALGGHATLFRPAPAADGTPWPGDRSAGVFTPLPAPLLAIHRRLKAEFDPAGILNPGRLYLGL